jgi:UDP-3-O-[3-hydroxymyristoyl] glucosamine N-acyltransferase
MKFMELAGRIQPAGGLRLEEWGQHENGGGWVQKTARVAETAYVGPLTIISGEAQILQCARIVDEASVTGMAIVAGNALIGGRAYVGGQAKVGGDAKILGSTEVGGFFSMTDGELTTGVHRPLDCRNQKRWEACRFL